MSITVKTDAKPLEVTTLKHAKKLIETSAFAHQLTHKELKEFKELQKLADHFSIDTNSLAITKNRNERERNQGYENIYRFPEVAY